MVNAPGAPQSYWIFSDGGYAKWRVFRLPGHLNTKNLAHCFLQLSDTGTYRPPAWVMRRAFFGFSVAISTS